ncbi:MAG: Gfo/Idh/MocA family oxidoreductase [Clostridia bacterium]|nr:Gfo/Idh/MocA family oxidoreductase [Clostridia bacterium]
MKKVAIIGCGMIANAAHIPAYRHRPDDFEIVGVCDVNEKSAKETAQRHGIANYFSDAEKMLKALSPDLVSICVPNMFHGEYIRLAIDNGADVLCEKPLSVSYKEAKELYALAESKGRILCACQSMRFTPDRLAAKAIIEKGELGEIYYGEFARLRRRGIPTWGAFHIEKINGGGAFVDIGVHMLDALVWLMGPSRVVSVSGTTNAKIAHGGTPSASLAASGALTGETFSERVYSEDEFDVEDFAAGSILFEGDKRINFKTAWAVNLPDETSISLVGDAASLRLPELDTFTASENVRRDISSAYENPYPSEAFPGHFQLIDNIADFYAGKASLIVKPEETLTVCAIIDLFYRSAKAGREINFSEIE